MKVLITGVAGFIGSNLAAALLEHGYTVIGLDNLSQGHTLNMATFADHPAFQFLEGDVCQQEDVNRAAEGCDTIVHLAAYKIPRYSDAYDTLYINTQGAHTVLKAAATNKAKLIAASTSDVYGKNRNLPFQEDHDLVIGKPDVKRWAYAISKMYEEQLLFAGHERFGVDVVLLRFFGGYGPNQNLTWWGGPQSVFINNALDNKEIPVHGDGMQTRSFTYVSDHVQGIRLCIEKETANNQVFNLGHTYEITIKDLAILIWRLVRGAEDTPQIRLIPYETFGKYEDVRRRVPDISRARDLLGFVPQVSLEEGLKRTLAWQIERRQALGIPTPIDKAR